MSTDPLDEIRTYDDEDKVDSFPFENEGDTVEGEIVEYATAWTQPKENKWGNMSSYLPMRIRTDDGAEWMLWPALTVYESGSKVLNEFGKCLAAARGNNSIVEGGRLKVRYDGKAAKTNSKGMNYEVGTYTMRYTPPAAPDPLESAPASHRVSIDEF